MDKKKVHLCCGDIYLEDYINCDIKGHRVAADEPNGNITTLDNYFCHPFIADAKERQKNRRPILLDLRVDMLEPLPWEDSSIDEIVLINALEHFTFKQVKEHIKPEIYRVLKPSGKFIFDVPDIKGILTKYLHSQPNYAMELIYCNWKDEYSVHKFGYTKKSLSELFEGYFIIKEETIVKHDYPSLGFVGIRT